MRTYPVQSPKLVTYGGNYARQWGSPCVEALDGSLQLALY